MVDALEKAHGLLKADGTLVNVQPAAEPSSLEVHRASVVDQAGWIGHRRDFATYKQSRAALAQAVENGWFVVERENRFPFLYHADTWSALKEWMDEKWENAVLNASTARRTQELLRAAGPDGKIVVHSKTVITRLRPQSRQGLPQEPPVPRNEATAGKMLVSAPPSSPASLAPGSVQGAA